MGRKYSINGSQAVASPTDSVLGLTGGTTIRPEVFFLLFGSTASPADNALQFLVQRYTAVGAGSSVTPEPLDPADPAAIATALENHTTEPTYTAGDVLLDVPLNQRGTYQWWATEHGGLKLPATANNGIGVQPVHSSFTGVVNATMHFEE